MKKGEWKERLKPYDNALRFVVVLLLGNALWKLMFRGDESGYMVTCCGWDVTRFFTEMSCHVAAVSAHILGWFIDGVRLLYGRLITFQNGNGISIVWGCTAVKQAALFVLIMLFARGPWKHKLWFVPLSLCLIYLFNLFRIVMIALLVMNHPDWFDLLHSYIFKYLFYAFLFLIWVIWAECFAEKKNCLVKSYK